MGGEIIFDHGTTAARRACILIKKGVNLQVKKVITSQEGRWVIVVAELDEKLALLCNIYAPNKDDPNFFLNIFNQIREESYDYQVIGGDFNVILDREYDQRSSKNY